jgi:ABC-type transporter Mla subunit MlaD
MNLLPFISYIVPKHIDPVTQLWLNVQTIVFCLFFAWIIVPITMRWVQVVINQWYIRNNQLKNSDMDREMLKDTLFKQTSWAKPYYDQFHRAWKESKPKNDSQAILPIRLREFLPPEIVLDGARNQRLAESIPGIFVSFGILGTFYGLITGLGDIELDKLENLQAGVGHLISGLSIAFSTSLVGIAFSIVFSFIYRIMISRLERSFLSLDQMLVRIYPFNSHELYVRKNYDLQADIKQGLQTLATDVAMGIGDKFGKAIDEHLFPLISDFQELIRINLQENKNQQNEIFEKFNENLTQLSEIISNHFDHSQEKQAQAMGQVLQQYSETLTTTFTHQFDSMSKIIEETTQSQKEIKQQLVTFTEALSNQLQAQGQLIDKTNRAGEILGQSLDSLESIAQKLKNSADSIYSASELLDQSSRSVTDSQQTLHSTMETQINAMKQTAENLQLTWSEITTQSSQLVSQVTQSIRELTENVENNLIKALSSFDANLAEIVERFSGTLYETNETISSLPGLVNKMKEAIAGQELILNDIREVSKGLVADNIKQAVDAANHLSQNTDRINQTLSGLDHFFETYSQKITDQSETMNQQYATSLNTLNTIVEKIIQELQAIKRIDIMSILEKFQPARDNNQTESLEILTQLKSLPEDINNVAKTVSDQQEQLKEISKALNTKNEQPQTIQPQTGWNPFKRKSKNNDDQS